LDGHDAQEGSGSSQEGRSEEEDGRSQDDPQDDGAQAGGPQDRPQAGRSSPNRVAQQVG
jgi:hypothetical protein